jgi:hypothetical protein
MIVGPKIKGFGGDDDRNGQYPEDTPEMTRGNSPPNGRDPFRGTDKHG